MDWLFPCARCGGGGLAMAVGLVKGIKFGGAGRSLTRIFFFVVIPTAKCVLFEVDFGNFPRFGIRSAPSIAGHER